MNTDPFNYYLLCQMQELILALLHVTLEQFHTKFTI